MELSHQSHRHPLFFVDGESETDELVRCRGCRNDICGGRYSCLTCEFHLHKSCTELPPSLEDHPFHRQHPLALLPRFPYRGRYRCDACGKYAYGLVYQCSLCNFKLHSMCALSLVQKGSIFSERIGNQHLLMLKEEEQSDDNHCFVCWESISAPFFSCSKSRCRFRLHKSCADLPLTLHHNSFHPQHPLLLISQSGGRCQLCGQKSHSSAYYYICWPCGFSIHPRCALSDPMENIKRMGEKQIQHFTHQHLLTCLQNEAEYADIQKRIPGCSSPQDEGELEGKREKEIEEYAKIKKLIRDCSSSEEEEEEESEWRRNKIPCCNLCKKEVASFPSYGCQWCPFILHKSCAELPPQIKKTHFHLDHFLFLFALPPTGPEKKAIAYCDCCDTEVSYFNYRCVQCGFMLHGDCFLSQHGSKKLYDHKHCFIKLEKFMKLTCQTCGEEGYFCPWQCSSCHIMVHKKCVALPRILKLESHHHNVKLTYYLSSLHQCDEMRCRLCYRKVNIDYAAYYCSECNYAAHIDCAPKIGVLISEEEKEDGDNSSKESQNSRTTSDNTSSPVEGNKIGVIQHFSHQHELTLMEQELEDHKYCKGCVRLIFPPFYSCKECNFYLHKKCGESPRTKKHPFHRHLLTLDVVDKPCRCYECENRFNGFMYSCQNCGYKLDLQCADIFLEGLQHPCHEHPLFFPYTSRNFERCRGCGERQKHILVCSKCDDYALGYCCLRIPQVAKHRYDDHVLNLSYKMEDESGEYYCEICEEKRDSKNWFYSCSQCEFSAHIYCILGGSSHFKYGTTVKCSSHDHPFTLVEECKRKPPPLCKSCGKHCYSSVLECCQCNIHFHFSHSCLAKAYPEVWNYLF